MKILVTNDDGITAEALVPLAKWAQKLGDVTVIAPKYEQSGKSHAIELIKPIEIKEYPLLPGIKAYSVDSTPADCVRFGIIGLKQKYDLVISGINRGFNIGHDIVYSGTVGAIFEAAAYGQKAIAFSTDRSPEGLEAALSNLDRVYDFITSNGLLDKNLLYNVNIPPNPSKICVTRQGNAFYSDEFVMTEPDMYVQKGEFVYEDTLNFDLDTDAVMHGYISIMPLSDDRTSAGVYEEIKHLNASDK